MGICYHYSIFIEYLSVGVLLSLHEGTKRTFDNCPPPPSIITLDSSNGNHAKENRIRPKWQ